MQGTQDNVKGHPLVWREVVPEWAESLDDGDVLRREETRVREIMGLWTGRVGATAVATAAFPRALRGQPTEEVMGV